MSPDLDAELCRLAPNLYRGRRLGPRNSNMAFGFECGDGWFEPLKELAVALEAEIMKLPETKREHCCASQVKEKLGGLRHYMWGSTDEMEQLIQVAEARCRKTCERCGKRGTLGELCGWWSTLCRTHRKAERDRLRPFMLKRTTQPPTVEKAE